MDQIGFAVPLMRRRDKRVWLAKRRKVLGATDAVAVLGYSKWATPVDVWLEKTGRYSDDRDSYPMRRGRLLENLLVCEWAAMNPDARLLSHPPLVGHPDLAFLAASLDAAAELDGQQVVIEAETASWRAREEWWDEDKLIPDAYAVQVLIQLAVTGLEVAHVVADVAGDYRTVVIERDWEFERWALPELELWWNRHVAAGEPPDPDPVRDYRQLSRVWVPQPGLSIEADSLLLSDIRAYAHARAEYKEREQIVSELRGRIRIAMKEATAVTCGGERIASVSKSGALTVKQQHVTEDGDQ